MALQYSLRDGSAVADLYAGESHIEPARRVFVNRNLRMRNIHAIGFDMDYTIAVYDKYVLEKLAFDATRDKLIAEMHYPEAIRALEYDPELVIRGLVVDKRLGNVLKIDQYSYVTRGYHGKRLIPSEARKRIYRSTRIRLSSDKYMSIDTLFGLPEAALFMELVDWFELHEKNTWRDYSRLYDDVRRCIDRAHADNTIKREIVNDPARFIVKDPQLPATLAAFRSQGKKLFLLTNSEPYYTETVMHYLLDGAIEQYGDWRSFFDVVVVSAGKPDFYQQDRPMPELGAAEMEQAGLRADGPPVYTRGCARLLEERVGHRGDEILYVGDHTFGDILRAKKRPGWRTAMLIEELRREIELDRALQPRAREIDALLARRTHLTLEMNRLRRRAHHLAHRGGTGEVAAPDRRPRARSGASVGCARAVAAGRGRRNARHRQGAQGGTRPSLQRPLGQAVQVRRHQQPLRASGQGLRVRLHQRGEQLPGLSRQHVLPFDARSHAARNESRRHLTRRARESGIDGAVVR